MEALGAERGRNIESFPATPARAASIYRLQRVEVTYQMNINKRSLLHFLLFRAPLSLSLSLALVLSRYVRGETNFISAGVARARTRTTARIPFFLPAAPPAAFPNPGYGRSKWPGEKTSSRIFPS